MAEVRVSLRNAGFRELRLSREVAADVMARGQRALSAASRDGGNYVLEARPSKNRFRASIRTGDYRTRAKNNKHNSLLRSLDAAR